MDTIGQRIKHVIVFNGLTMTGFAKELNITQSMVSKICSDKATPSNRTIADICRIYHINTDWLLHGHGEMVNKQSLISDLSKSFTSVLPEIGQKMLLLLSEIPPAVWPVLEKHLEIIANDCKSQTRSLDVSQNAYDEGKQAGIFVRDAIEKAINDLPENPEE